MSFWTLRGETTGVAGANDLSLDTGNFNIGRRLFGTQLYFKGKIDDVCLYNSVLNPAEVQALYQNGQ